MSMCSHSNAKVYSGLNIGLQKQVSQNRLLNNHLTLAGYFDCLVKDLPHGLNINHLVLCFCVTWTPSRYASCNTNASSFASRSSVAARPLTATRVRFTTAVTRHSRRQSGWGCTTARDALREPSLKTHSCIISPKRPRLAEACRRCPKSNDPRPYSGP